MKTMFFGAAAAFLILGGAAAAKPVVSDTQAVQAPAVVVMAKHKQTQLLANPLAKENPTGLPAYEMRPDGLMINGLLPAQGWEG
ncbi:MAG TPA: hypothetical protein VHY82_02810 [Acetobacteraceae bacterium]|nr:hypothetical protein [Acetobacteraceae bacterium]